MHTVGEVLTFSALFYFFTFLLGYGLSSLLLPEEKRDNIFFFAPWVGIVQTGLVLTLFGAFNIGTDQSFRAAIAVSIFFILVAKFKSNCCVVQKLFLKKNCLIFAGTILAVSLLMLPVIKKSNRLTSFSIGNNDIFDYALSAQILKKRGITGFIEGYNQVKGLNLYDHEVGRRLEAWNYAPGRKMKDLLIFLGYLPRWLPVYYLAFLSSATRMAPEIIFSLLTISLYIWFIPLIWIFARKTLNMEGGAVGIGCALALLNPHILYIVYHGFLPQIMALGFFICFLILFPGYIEAEDIEWKKAAFLVLPAVGILMSYQQLIPFLLVIIFTYSLWHGLSSRTSWPASFKKISLLVLAVAVLAPFQTYRLVPLLWSEFTESVKFGGWPVTDHFYLVPFQLGAFFSSAKSGTMNPALLLEWLLNPLLIYFIFISLAPLKRRSFVISVLFPFLIAGIVAFLQGHNYAYYKNFTLLYFMLPLLIGGGLYSIRERIGGALASTGGIQRISVWIWSGLAIFICALPAARSSERILTASRSGMIIPAELENLGVINGNPEIDRIFISGLNGWETLWASYYLMDKEIVLPDMNRYLKNNAGALKDANLRFVLAREKSYNLLDPLNGRKIKNQIFNSGKYLVYKMTTGDMDNVLEIKLGRGFYDIENNDTAQWVWMKQEAELFVDSGKTEANAVLNLELYSVQNQNVQLTVNGRTVSTMPLKEAVRNSCRIKMGLRKGANHILLKTDRAPLLKFEGDSRALNVQFFKIGLE